MKFEIGDDAIKDMAVLFGKEHAINEIVNAFRAIVVSIVAELEEGDEE